MRKKTSSAIKELSNQVLANSPFATGLYGLNSEKIVEYGFPPDVITDVAQKGQYDLIVVGRKALRKTKVFSRGSVVDEVATKAKCPVLIVP